MTSTNSFTAGANATSDADAASGDGGDARPVADAAGGPDTIEITAIDGYRAGVCNIGPDEIARRRRSGHVGLIASAGLLAGLVAIGAPRPARLAVAVPAAGAAAGYLQARLRFCAGFGAIGVYNFGPVGRTVQVEDRYAAVRDRRMAIQIGLASAAIGAAAGIGAALLPR